MLGKVGGSGATGAITFHVICRSVRMVLWSESCHWLDFSWSLLGETLRRGTSSGKGQPLFVPRLGLPGGSYKVDTTSAGLGGAGEYLCCTPRLTTASARLGTLC